MKTAMQELIKGFDEIIDSELIEINYMYVSGIIAAKKRALELLEKEKEQIIEAHNEGIWHIEKCFDEGEEYYNKKYN